MTKYPDNDLLISSENGVGLITLNRPNALNALSLDILDGLQATLLNWGRDEQIRAVIIRGAGGRAFCAGGDVRAAYEAHVSGDDEFAAELFRREYSVDYLVASFPKPFVALMDGIVLGGGCGISVHGSHRIVTETTMLAMPETGIGFFPDVGASVFLAKCPGRVGLYLGLTGDRLTAGDAVYAGLADAFLPQKQIEAFITQIIGGSTPDQAVDEFCEKPGSSALALYQAEIDRCFGAPDLNSIVGSLENDGGPWSEKCLDTLSKKSPFSLEITYKLLNNNENISISDSLITDYRICRHLLKMSDFYEGVRAVLVDRDNEPKWKPATIAGVERDEIEACFAPLGKDDLVLPPLSATP